MQNAAMKERRKATRAGQFWPKSTKNSSACTVDSMNSFYKTKKTQKDWMDWSYSSQSISISDSSLVNNQTALLGNVSSSTMVE